MPSRPLHVILSAALAALLVFAPSLRAVETSAAPVTTPAPGTPLPASGGNLEPGSTSAPGQAAPDVVKPTTPQPDASSSSTWTPPELKPMNVHAERDAEIGRLVGELLEQHHYLQKPITPDMSQRWLKLYFIALDPSHLFFLQSDIDEFTAKYGNNLGDLLLHSDSETAAIDPAFEIFQRYMRRVTDDVALSEKLVHEKFDFTKDETFKIPNDKSNWLADQAASDAIWRQQVKYDRLNGVLDKKSDASTIDRLSKRYESLLRDRSEMDDLDVLEKYLTALTSAYDPHSTYFAPETAQDFDIQAIHLMVTGIGARLKDDDGYATIDELIAGGPADLDKRLHSGDRIIAVGQGTKEPVDTINMKLSHVVDMIRGPKGSKVHLVVLPAGSADSAVHKDIILTRDTVSLKDSLAKAEIIDHKLPDGGTEKLGVVTLHDFYNDTATDCAKLIERLEKENVAGIILDVRNNGGGLLDQAVDLTGLFVKKEPVVQIRRTDGYVDQLNTDNSRAIYSGPLLVMVNKYSASATEITAAALQDFGRAIIVGDKSTHGKGTVQTLIPLDQQAPLGFTADPGKLKMTIQKFYRVAGGSTQQKGVEPDIVLPSLLDALELGESTLPYSLPYDTVPAVTYDYLDETSAFLPELRAKSAARVAASPDFGYIRQDIDYYKKKVQDNTVSLNEATRIKEQADYKATMEARKKDLLSRAGTRDKMYDLTLDEVDQNLPPTLAKAPKKSTDDSDDDQEDADLSAEIESPVVDPQLNEAVDIMCDYTQALHNAGSSLVQSAPAVTK